MAAYNRNKEIDLIQNELRIIELWDIMKVSIFLRKHGGKTGEELKAKGK